MRILVLTLFILLAAAGCASTQRGGEGDIVEGTGTVRYIEVEGGFYGIVADDGRQFDPRNLDESYKEDGLRIHFRLREVDDAVSIRMWGRIVDIISIERI